MTGLVQQLPIASLKPYAKNARTHDDRQIETLRNSIEAFGFQNPILVDADNVIVAGHGRVEGAKRLGMTHVPALRVEGLSPNDLRAYRLADNRLAELAGWDQAMVEIELQYLVSVELDYSIETLGWDMPEIDVMLNGETTLMSAGETAPPDPADALPDIAQQAVSRPGDIWVLGKHRLLCGSVLDEAAFARLMQGRKARHICQDPPWNIAVKDISGLGKTQHRPFAMGNGEMSGEQFRAFLEQQLAANLAHAEPGAAFHVFIDWRGLATMVEAGRAIGLELLNVCVWVKTNGGMGSLYRSQHEFVPVFKAPGGPVKNNVELGRHGRYRTNVWQMPGCNAFGKERMALLESHPTAKPVQLIAEAIRDVTDIGEIVLDSFMGSGTTLIAAERTGRIAYGVEIDPLYVDLIVKRWETFTGHQAVLEGSGRSFAETASERAGEMPIPAPQAAGPKVRYRPPPGRIAA
jgi:DNA modification methylase